MISGFLKSLFDAEDAAAESRFADDALAIAALLARAGWSDGALDAAERATAEATLARRFDLSPEDAATLFTEGEAAEREAADLVRFTRAIKAAVPFEDRADVVADFWRVALADGVRSPDENALIRQLIGLLGVSDKDSGLARQRAQQD